MDEHDLKRQLQRASIKGRATLLIEDGQAALLLVDDRGRAYLSPDPLDLRKYVGKPKATRRYADAVGRFAGLPLCVQLRSRRFNVRFWTAYT